jgi:hypothetical protein
MLVLANFRVEPLDRARIRVVARGISHAAAPQHVVHRDEPAGTQEFQAAFVIGVVVRLVRVDEREIEAARLAVGEQRLHRIGRRPDPQIDLAGHAGALPELAAHGGVVLAHVAGDDAPVRGQREGHAQRAVAGEDADLDAAPGADRLGEEPHQRTLRRPDLHAAARHLRGGGAQRLLRGMLAHAVGEDVVLEPVLDAGLLDARHDSP